MKILNYRTDHSAGDIVYLIGKVNPPLPWGVPMEVISSGHFEGPDGRIEYRVMLDREPGIVYAPEFFVNQDMWVLMDLAVFNLVYANGKNKEL